MDPDSSSDNDNQSVAANAREAGKLLRDLAHTIGEKAKQATKETSRKAKSYSDVSATIDSQEMNQLGNDANVFVSQFEQTCSEIQKEDFEEQARLLASYKSFLEEQSKLVSARMVMARNLKPGA